MIAPTVIAAIGDPSASQLEVSSAAALEVLQSAAALEVLQSAAALEVLQSASALEVLSAVVVVLYNQSKCSSMRSIYCIAWVDVNSPWKIYQGHCEHERQKNRHER